MAKIISFGDSFTWGSDMEGTVRYDLGQRPPTGVKYIDTYSKKTWHALLANDLNMEYVCLAREGCSNQTIFRTFFENIDLFKKDDIINVNFTWRDRYDFLDPLTLQYESIRPSSTKDDSKFAEMYYKHIHSHYWDNIESLKVINLIIDFLENQNFKYIVTSIDEMIYFDNVHTNDLIKNLRNQYNNKIIWFDGKGLYQWSKENNYPISEMWHPLEYAHEQAFKYIKKIYI